MNRIFFFVGLTTIALAAFLMLYLFWMFFLDGNPPATIQLPYATEKTEYRIGEPIVLTANICKSVRYPLTTYPYLVKIPDAETSPKIKSKIFPLPPISSAGTPVGCGEYTISGFFTVPLGASPGRYSLQGTNVFKVNFLVSRSVEWHTNEFDILPL